MIVIYHRADMDGICSAAIAHHRWPDAELVGMDYGEDLAAVVPATAAADRELLMVDFSLPMREMVALGERFNLTWIDHHKTAIEAAEAGGFNPAGLRHVGHAACELTWRHVYHSGAPFAVWLLGRYDVWDLDAHPDVMTFQHAARHHLRDPRDVRWAELFSYMRGDGDTSGYWLVRNLLVDGRLLQESAERQSAAFANECAFETTLDGLRFIALNGGRSSRAFLSVWDPYRYDAMLAFTWVGRFWRCSLYTDRADVDVSQVAKAHGGGGHRQAAGFQCLSLPFDLPAPPALVPPDAASARPSAATTGVQP